MGTLSLLGAGIQNSATVPTLFRMGFDFRATQAYVTDPSDCVFFGGNGGSGAGTNYSAGVTFTNDLFSMRAGYLGSDLVANLRDRSTAVPKLAGTQWAAGIAFPAICQFDLPSTGNYSIRAAFGDPSGGAVEISNKFYDGIIGSGETLFQTIGPVTLASGEFRDANNVTRTSAADWVANNVAITRTFTTTTFQLTLERDLASISHVYIQKL